MSVMEPRIVVFVGAGASKAAFSESPLMGDYFDRAADRVRREIRQPKRDTEVLRIARALMMLEVHGLFQTPNSRSAVIAGHLWDRFRHKTFWLYPEKDEAFLPVVRRYMTAWKAHPVGIDGRPQRRRENLEETFLTLDQMPDDALLDTRFRKDAEFERSIFTLLASLYKQKSVNSHGYTHLKRVIRCCMKSLHESDTALIVNFNYDPFMDHALYHTLAPSNVATLYGGILDFEIEATGVRAKQPKAGRLSIWMVKPHGSINWSYSRGGDITEYACSSIGPDGRFYIPSFDQTCFFHRTKWYQPKRWIRPILTAPKPKKDYLGPCKQSLNAVLSGVNSADEVWIFGWSMPSSDRELVDLIANAVKARSKPIEWLRIVDVKGDHQYILLEEKARKLFMPDRVQSHWGGLQTWRDWSTIRHPSKNCKRA